MKSLKLTSLLCGSVLSITATNALAQESSTQPGSAQPQRSQSSQRQSSSSIGSSTAASSALGASSAMHSDQSVRLSDLMRSSVQSQEGKTLGHIRDFTIDPQSGRVEFAILSLSSAGAATDTSTSGRETVPSSRSSVTGTPSTAASMTGKLIPVPWQLFSQSWSSSRLGTTSSTTPGATMGQHNLVLNIDESKLQTAPSFDANNWNQLQTGTLDQRVYSHFGVDESSAIGTPGSSLRGQGTGQAREQSTQPYSTQPQSTQPQSTQPQGTQPQSTLPDSSQPQSSSPSTSPER